MISEDEEKRILDLIDAADKELKSSQHKAQNDTYLEYVEKRSRMRTQGTTGFTPTKPERPPLAHTSVAEAVEAAKQRPNTDLSRVEKTTAPTKTRDRPSRYPRGHNIYRIPAF